MRIEELPGIEPHHAQSLRSAGICTCRHLLQAARYPDRLAGLSRASRLSIPALCALVDRAELSQFQGIGPALLAYLVAAGIAAPSVLAAQEPEVLRLRLSRVMPHPPNLAVVEHWIAQARRREKRPGQEESPAPGSC